MASEERAGRIAGEIARYLVRHPGAGDTFDGISRWWISRIRLDEALDDVRLALDELVEQGVVLVQEQPDGSRYYRSALQR